MITEVAEAMLRALGEAELTLFHYISPLRLIVWVSDAPWHALAIAGILSGYYALVRLALGSMRARFFDISSIGTIVLWIGFLPYELHVQAWEKTVVAPIRLDLLLVAIVLDTVTVVALLSSLWPLFRKVRAAYSEGGKMKVIKTRYRSLDFVKQLIENDGGPSDTPARMNKQDTTVTAQKKTS